MKLLGACPKVSSLIGRLLDFQNLTEFLEAPDTIFVVF